MLGHATVFHSKKKIVQQLKAEIKFFKVLQRLFIHDEIYEIIKLI